MRRHESSTTAKLETTTTAAATDNCNDYMSMDFITSAQSFDNDRNTKTSKRKKKRRLFSDSADTQAQASNFEPQTKKLKVRMEEQRNKGLQQPIAESNIGFKLLQKMGYKNGMKIGKKEHHNDSRSGLTVPIKIEIRHKNSGLGIHERERQNAQRLHRLISVQTEERHTLFKDAMRRKAARKQTINDIRRSSVICENLDVSHEINLQNPLWYKSSESTQSTLENDKTSDHDLEQLQPQQQQQVDEIETMNLEQCQHKLDDILTYLRSTHFYCFWCGIKYDNEQQLKQSCPGNDKTLHDSLCDF